MQVVPHAATYIAFLVNPDSLTADPKLREMENAARMLDRRLQVFNARSESEFEQAFLAVEQQRLGAMVVTLDTMFQPCGAGAMGAYPRFRARRRAGVERSAQSALAASVLSNELDFGSTALPAGRAAFAPLRMRAAQSRPRGDRHPTR